LALCRSADLLMERAIPAKPLVACIAEDLPCEGAPVLPSRLGTCLDLIEPAALIWVAAVLVAASLRRRAWRADRVHIERAKHNEPVAAFLAEHPPHHWATRELQSCPPADDPAWILRSWLLAFAEVQCSYSHRFAVVLAEDELLLLLLLLLLLAATSRDPDNGPDSFYCS
jgi:hypothetical protein